MLNYNYLCYRMLTTHQVLHVLFCYLIVVVCLVVVDVEVKLFLSFTSSFS